jgi:hypothetical protein
MNANKEGLIAQIESIKSRIVKDMSGCHYICVHAQGEVFEEDIVKMVRRHIGRAYTLDAFLKKKWKMKASEELDIEVVNSYRVCMLNNMIKMVKEGKHRG